MRIGSIMAFVFTAFASTAGACTANSAAQHPHLVELYSSEGCDSCPPAEHWMSSLLTRADVAGLEFHVDYWDNADWRDPFSQHVFSERQQKIARRGAGDQVYTPQIWVDGQVWRGWPTAATLPDLPTTAAPALKMQVDGGDGLRVQLEATTTNTQAAQTYRLYLALTENGLTRDVGGGENRGKRLHHDGVVRAFAGPLDYPRAEVNLSPPTDVNRAQATLVAFIQAERSGIVVQVLRQPLAACTK